MKRLLLLLTLLAAPVQADPSELHTLTTGDDSRGWEAVGRLNIAGQAFCTGALISESLVLTAAHCLYDSETGARYDDPEIEFLAGWRDGRAAAYRNVRRAVVNPDYVYRATDKQARVANDLALLELDQPIRTSGIVPFATGSALRKGDEVGVVSYGQGRADSASLQETCKVLAKQQGTVVMNCDVELGSSGSPVFAMQNGIARIVSVVSAKAHAGDMPVSLGSDLSALDAMTAELALSDGMFTSVSSPDATVVNRSGGAAGSAKFVRP